MKNNKTNLKKWYALAKPSKKYFILQSIMGLLARADLLLVPIAAAKVIVSLTKADYKSAIIFASIVFALEAVRQIFWHIYYMSAYKSNAYSYLNIQEKIFKKFLNVDDGELKKNSKERILNTINNDVYEVAVLSREIASKIGIFLRILITIIVVSIINIYVGAFLAIVTIINYWILNNTNTNKAKWVAKRESSKDKVLEKFNNILENRTLIKKLNIDEKIKEDYINAAKKFAINTKEKEWFWMSMTDNWWYAFTRLVIYVGTFAMITLMSNGAITLTLYLIVVPYIETTMSESQSLFEILTLIKQKAVSVARVNTVLEMDEYELIKYGDNNNDAIDGNIVFSNVSYKNDDKESELYGEIKNADFSIKKDSITIIKGQKQSGKRQLFYLLNRYMKPDNGTILLDNISIFEYDNVYSTNVNYLTYKPTFINGSIMRNMNLLGKNCKKVIEIAKEVGIHDFISSLPKGYNTDINKSKNLISNEKLFLFALCRILLTKSEVIILYELPTSLTEEEMENIKNILKKYSEEKTIIIFTAQDMVDDIADKIIKVSRNVITTKVN